MSRKANRSLSKLLFLLAIVNAVSLFLTVYSSHRSLVLKEKIRANYLARTAFYEDFISLERVILLADNPVIHARNSRDVKKSLQELDSLKKKFKSQFDKTYTSFYKVNNSEDNRESMLKFLELEEEFTALLEESNHALRLMKRGKRKTVPGLIEKVHGLKKEMILDLNFINIESFQKKKSDLSREWHRHESLWWWNVRIAVLLLFFSFLITIVTYRRSKIISTLLKREEQILGALNEFAIVAQTDTKGVITYVNERFCEISQYSSEELIGKDHRILNSSFHSKAFFKEMWNTITSGKSWRAEIMNKKKDGSFYWVDTFIYPIKSVEGRVKEFMAFRFDITEKKNQQQKLVESDRLNAVGKLAGGMAHEIGNPLTIIEGKVEQILTQLEPLNFEDPVVKSTLKISEMTDRIGKIINHLKCFSNDKMDDFQETDLRSTMIITRDFCEETMKTKGIKFMMDEVPEGFIPISIQSIQQVLFNLIQNSIEAVRDDKNPWIQICFLVELDTVKIRVVDSGPGLKKNVERNLMVPFFTTKDVGEGTGMGLAVSKGMIQSAGGSLSFLQEANNTTFEIELPFILASREVA